MTNKFKLGDAIAKLTKALHIPHCEKCEERRRILNEVQKLGIKETVKRLRAVGAKGSSDEQSQSLEHIMEELKNCCDE